MKKLALLSVLALAGLTGCTNTGAFISANQTLVNLNEGNYSITAVNVTGVSQAAYVFGFSYSAGLMSNTFAIGRVEGSGQLYADAMENLWANYGAVHGQVEQNRLALTNIRYDTDILNLFFYTRVRLIIRADVIEFD